MRRRMYRGVMLGVVGVCLAAIPSVRAQSCPNDGAGSFPLAAGGTLTVNLGQISGAGATLFNPFFSSPAGTNDWIDVDNDGEAGFFNFFPFVDQLASQYLVGSSLTTEWVFQYRPVGSVNGLNEFVENQTCGALRQSVPADVSLFNGFTWANTGGRVGGGPFGNPSGTPFAPCSIDFAALDVPSFWGVQVPGAPQWDRKPGSAGYGLNPILSSTGYLSNLLTLGRQCGTCADSRPCTSNINCNGTCIAGTQIFCLSDADCAGAGGGTCVGASTCTLGGPVVQLNQNPVTDANTVFDSPAVHVPVGILANRGTGLQGATFTELEYLFTTGRMPNGENLTAATRSVGSGTRNAAMTSLGIDTSWARGDNVGNELTVTGRYNLGPGTQQTNCEGSGQEEQSVLNHRLAVGYTGLGGGGRAVADMIAGQYEIVNTCKDIPQPGHAACDCTNPANFVRPTINTVLDNCDPCTGYQIGGDETFVTRGSHTGSPQVMANQAAADYFSNIFESLAAFDGNPQPNQCLYTEVCSSKKCSGSPDATCTGTGQGTCPSGQTCAFVTCALDSDCSGNPPGLGTCGIKNCTVNGDCTIKTCSVDHSVCTGSGPGTCSQVPDAQTCDPDICRLVANMPGQFMATAFFLLNGIDCAQAIADGNAWGLAPGFSQSVQDYVRGHNGFGVGSDTPAFGSTNTAGQVPIRNALGAGNFYSDGSTTGSYEYWDGANYVTITAGGKLSKRNRLTGDFNKDGVRDLSDASELVKAAYGPRAWQKTAAASGTGTGFDLGNQTADNAIPEVMGDFNGDGSLDKEDLRYFADGLSLVIRHRCNGGTRDQRLCLDTDPNNDPVYGGCPGGGVCNSTKDALSLNRKQGAIDIDAAIQALSQPFPWAEPAQSITVPAAAFPGATEPTFSAPHDVNTAPKFLKTGKVYAHGDFRGDVAGGGYQACVNGHCNYTNETCVTAATCPRTPPTPGAQPMGWDGVVDDKDINYCCKVLQAGTWFNLTNATRSDLSCDMNGDADVTFADIQELVQGILGTAFGDVNLDGVADATDRAVIQASIDGPNPCIATQTCVWADGDMNCDGVVDAQDLASLTPAPQNASSPVDKPRYLSFQESSAVAAPVAKAIRVTLVSLMRPSPANLPQFPAPDYSGFEGEVRWAGPPQLCVESQAPPASFSCSALQCTPEYRTDWASWGDIHLNGSAIVPSSRYAIQSIYLGMDINVESNYSAALTQKTGRWGDVVTPFQQVCTCNTGGAECVVTLDCGLNGPCNCPALTQPNIGDISSIVDKFKAVSGAPIVARADLVPNAPDNVVNIADISACVDSFKNLQFVFAGPTSCGP